jgi:hypothetical protein
VADRPNNAHNSNMANIPIGAHTSKRKIVIVFTSSEPAVSFS